MHNWTQEQLQDWRTRNQDIPVKPTLPILKKSPLNKGETRFAQYLDLLKKGGMIREWYAQSWTFKLAEDCRYTPDFAALLTRGEWHLFDVKGRKTRKDGTSTYWAEEDAKIKIKVAAKLWPMFRWFITYPERNGEWTMVPVEERGLLVEAK